MPVLGNYREYTEESLEAHPIPSNTRTWTLTPQKQLVQAAQEVLNSRNLELKDTKHLVHKKRPVFVTTGTVVGSSLEPLSGESWTIALMNSYDKSISARILFGRHVFVCSNGIIHADRMLGTKHTGRVWSRLGQMVSEAVDGFVQSNSAFCERQRWLKQHYFGNDMLASFVMYLVSSGVLPKARAYDLFSETKSPSFDYGTNPMCLFNLQAAFTHLAKSQEPISRARSVILFEKELLAWGEFASN